MSIENNILRTSGVLQLKGGTAEAMRTVNPMLARREIAVEIDSGKIKVGDGTHYWNDLPYSGSSSSSTLNNGNVFMLVNHPDEWNPEIDSIDTIYLVLNENINPVQLTGLNSEVNI